MKKILAFFDIDGTLLPEGDMHIPDNTVQAVKDLKANGVDVFICTGRCYHQAKQYIDELGIDSFIVSNGQEAVVRGVEVYSYDMIQKEINELKEILESFDIHWGFETRDNIYLQENEGFENVKNMIDGYGLLKIKSGILGNEYKVKQMWAFGQEDILTDLESEILDNYRYFRWTPESMEIISFEESKAKAMRKVIEAQTEPVITYAFGDGFNDMELISEADVGVAMGNAKIEIKAVADYVTANCDDDGIAKALRHFGLI